MVSFNFALLALAVIPSFSVAAPLRHGSGLDLRHAHHRRSCKTASASSASATASSATSTYKSAVDVASTSTKAQVTTTTKASTVKASSTASSSAPAASASSGASGGSIGSLLQIFPVSVQNAISSWSTSSLVSNPLPLSDATLNIFKGKSTQHKYMQAPDGSSSMQAFYTAGSISPGHTSSIGGFAIYSKGPTDLSVGKEVTFSYSAFFEEGFQFNLGGKMPGLYGGTDDDVATTCSGGDHNPDCWSTRLMWRANGAGELYAYLPQVGNNNNQLQNTPPKTVTSDAYGTSVGRGAFKWATGAWTHVSQRVLLNDVGQANGEVEVYVNGVSVIKTTGLVFRTSAACKVRGAQIQTFFGGHEAEWASPKDQSAYFKDFSTAVIS